MTFASGQVLRISVRREEFRMGFEKPFRVVFLSSLLVVEPLGIVFCGIVSPIVILVWLPVMTAVLAAIAVLLLASLFRFEIGPQGIDCYDFWCHPQSMSWDAIGEVSTFSVLGLTYLRLHPRGEGRSIWLPAFVDRPLQFDDLLRTHAGPGHPISHQLQALREKSGDA